jgi:hypothetical protein
VVHDIHGWRRRGDLRHRGDVAGPVLKLGGTPYFRKSLPHQRFAGMHPATGGTGVESSTCSHARQDVSTAAVRGFADGRVADDRRADAGSVVKLPMSESTKQKNGVDLQCYSDAERQIIRFIQNTRGGVELTQQEINLSLAQAREIGEL